MEKIFCSKGGARGFITVATVYDLKFLSIFFPLKKCSYFSERDGSGKRTFYIVQLRPIKGSSQSWIEGFRRKKSSRTLKILGNESKTMARRNEKNEFET